jgi:hypothetical protein
VVLLIAVVASACGGREPETRRAIARRAEQARGVARRAGLTPAVQDFVALYASAPAAHMSVTYAVGAPGSGRVRVDQQPPRRRVDITTAGDSTLHSLFETPTGTYSCERVEAAWTCDRNDSGSGGVGVLDAADINRTVSTLTASRRDFDLRVGRRKLVGRQATCLITTPRTGSTAAGTTATSLCVSGQGTPLLIERSGESLRALRYSTHVDSARFRLPSRPRA